MLTVVAALIGHQGKLLVCQRRRGSRFELMWEFPGGKTEQGETLEEALARELREELGIAATIGAEIFRVRHTYSKTGEPLEIVFFTADAPPDTVRNLEFERIEWRAPESLSQLNFLAADRGLVEKLANGAIRLPGGNSGRR
jgi:mutator protein MutT